MGKREDVISFKNFRELIRNYIGQLMNDTLYRSSYLILLSVVTISVVMLLCIVSHIYCYTEWCYTVWCYAECLYAECLYAECLYAECRYAECLYAECRHVDCRGASFLSVVHHHIDNLRRIWVKKVKKNLFWKQQKNAFVDRHWIWVVSG